MGNMLVVQVFPIVRTASVECRDKAADRLVVEHCVFRLRRRLPWHGQRLHQTIAKRIS